MYYIFRLTNHMRQRFKNYINISYYNYGVFISIGWCTQKLVSNSPSEKNCFVADCTVNQSVTKFSYAKNIGGTGCF